MCFTSFFHSYRILCHFHLFNVICWAIQRVYTVQLVLHQHIFPNITNISKTTLCYNRTKNVFVITSKTDVKSQRDYKRCRPSKKMFLKKACVSLMTDSTTCLHISKRELLVWLIVPPYIQEETNRVFFPVTWV